MSYINTFWFDDNLGQSDSSLITDQSAKQISLILFVEPHIVLGTGRFIGFTWVSAFEDFIKNHLSWTIFRWIQSKTMFYLCSKEFLLIGNHFIFEWNCTSRDHHCISFTDSDIGKGWTMISILGIMFRIRGPGRLPPY